MDSEVVTLIVAVVLPTLLFLDLSMAKRSKDWARKAHGHNDRQVWEDRLVLKGSETVVGVMERRPRKYAFVTLDVTKSPHAEDH